MESSLRLLPGSTQVGQGKQETARGGGAGFSVYSLKKAPGVSDALWVQPLCWESLNWRDKALRGNSRQLVQGWRGIWGCWGQRLPFTSQTLLKAIPESCQWERITLCSLLKTLFLSPEVHWDCYGAGLCIWASSWEETGKAWVFTHFPDLIPFQGHGSLAAGGSQSCMHTFQQLCDQIWA